MKRKFFVGLAIGFFLFGMVGVASAYIIENVHLDFESGAAWDGTITFNDGYQGMIDTDGYLNGGTNNYANEHFSWTWWEGIGYTNPYDYNNDGYYNDWLMNGSESPLSYSLFIGLSWDTDASVNNGGVVFVPLNDPEYSGINSYDALTGWNATNGASSSVPEPATIILLGSGLFGLTGLARRGVKK